MKLATVGATLVLVLAFSAEAFAQRGDFGEFRNRLRWYPDVERVISSGAGAVAEPNNPFGGRRDPFGGMDVKKKYIFIYVRPSIAEDKDPNEFTNADIVQLSYGEWYFIKMDLDKENARLKAWGVKGGPMIIGCDLHGNDFLKFSALTLDSVRSITRGLPGEIQKYEAKLQADYRKACDFLKTDEAKGLKGLLDILAAGKQGYKEVTEAQAKLNDVSEAAFRRIELAESVSLETGIDYLDELVKQYGKTARGIQAEIRIAQLDHERGNVPAAVQRLNKILKYERLPKSEIDLVQRALEEVSKAGDQKIELALTGDRNASKELLRKLARDYAGTEAGKRATELSK